MKIGILGGGLSGITLQRFLNSESEVLEKETKIGGLCRTFNKNNYLYDIGGHILFSKKPEIMEFIKTVLGDECNLCKRDNKILYKGKYVKYPFENGLSVLDKEDIFDCLIGFIKNDYPSPNNFKEWIYYTFGGGIAEKYLIPYNMKIWKFPLSEMDMKWVERVPQPSLKEVVQSAIGINTEGYRHQLYFIYPKHGGIETLVKKINKKDRKVITNYCIQKISKHKNGWIVTDGKTEKFFQKIVVTFPIKEAISCFENVPEDVKTAVANLHHNKVRIILVGINNESLLNHSAIYVPQSDIAFHRMSYMGYFSRSTVPLGKSSIIAEVTTRKGQPWFDTTDDLLIEKIIGDLDNLEIINKNEVDTVDIQNIEYGYVIYDSNHNNNMKKIRKYFSSLGVNLLGRFAEFEYINMDETIRRAIHLADKINLSL
jgi:protoporphyrinogen oxidase